MRLTLLAVLCAPAVALAVIPAAPGASLAARSGSVAISRPAHAARSLHTASHAPILRMAGGPAEATETAAPSALVSVTRPYHTHIVCGILLLAPALRLQGPPGSEASG